MSKQKTRKPRTVIHARTAEQIARTELGPRPLPPLMKVRANRAPSSEELVLDNGLRVIALRRKGAPMVEVRLRIPFGGRTPQHSARAEVLANTMLLGTADESREDIDRRMADVGGHLDVSVDPMRLLISGSVLSSGLGDLTTLLGGVLTGAAYRRDDVAGERDRLVEYLRLATAQPGVAARMALQHKRFGNHPAAREMPESELVAATTPAMVRTLHKRAVVPEGSILVLVGDSSPGAMVDRAERDLSDWVGARPATVLSRPPAIEPGPLLGVDRPGSVQSQVRLTAPAPVRTDPDFAALQLANLIYGGFFSSRLVENIREDKGYTYTANSALEFWPNRAAITVGFDTTLESTAAALHEARYELGRIAVQAPSEHEVDVARNYLLGTMAISLSSQAGLASTVAGVLGAGVELEWLQQHPARLAAVTLDQVAEAAATYFAPSAFTGVVVSDLSQVGASLQRLGGIELP